jgi:hypothetical protein
MSLTGHQEPIERLWVNVGNVAVTCRSPCAVGRRDPTLRRPSSWSRADDQEPPAAATRGPPVLNSSADKKTSRIYAAAVIPNASQNAGSTTNFASAPCRWARVVKTLES